MSHWFMLVFGYKIKIVDDSGQVQERMGIWCKDFLQSLIDMELAVRIESMGIHVSRDS
jgi:hypothetical protein